VESIGMLVVGCDDRTPLRIWAKSPATEVPIGPAHSRSIGTAVQLKVAAR
jgi:hypothetical protein